MSLSHRVAIRVPSQCGCGQSIPNGRHLSIVEGAEQIFARAFGGAESTQVCGSYIMADGRLASEAVTVVSAFCSFEALAREVDEMRAYAVVLADSLNQESVALEIDGVLEFHKQKIAGNCQC